jgi:hypothetical protein
MKLPWYRLRNEQPEQLSRRERQIRTANNVTAALNDEGDLGIGEGLGRLLADMQEVEAIRAELCNSDCLPQRTRLLQKGEEYWGWPAATFSDERLEELNQRGSMILKNINKRLRRFRWSHELANFNYGEMMVAVKGHHKTETERLMALYIDHLIGYLQRGELGRFRHCVNCTKWFYAVTDHQRYCGGKCRLQNLAHSDEFKEKRARYMRERYRPLIKKLEQQSKRKAAQPKGR